MEQKVVAVQEKAAQEVAQKEAALACIRDHGLVVPGTVPTIVQDIEARVATPSVRSYQGSQPRQSETN